MAGAGPGAAHAHRMGAAVVGARAAGALCRLPAASDRHRPLGRGRCAHGRRRRIAPRPLLVQPGRALHPHCSATGVSLQHGPSQLGGEVLHRAARLPSAMDRARGDGHLACAGSRAAARPASYGLAICRRSVTPVPPAPLGGSDGTRHLCRTGAARRESSHRARGQRGAAARGSSREPSRSPALDATPGCRDRLCPRRDARRVWDHRADREPCRDRRGRILWRRSGDAHARVAGPAACSRLATAKGRCCEPSSGHTLPTRRSSASPHSRCFRR